MKKFFIIFIIFFISNCHAEIISGRVSERSSNYQSRIIDKKTGVGVSGAHITFPKHNYSTVTNKNGYFELDTAINGTEIMSVTKNKYKPFTMTVTEKTFTRPLEVGIEKSNSNEIYVDSNMYHLGDGSYSDNSANASDFISGATGPFYTKKFVLKNINYNAPIYLEIGTIIGIDTLTARTIGQNRVPNSYSSPPEVFFNGNKIAEIQINGDGQKIKLPLNLINKNTINEITIKTGRNLMQTSYVDYDDIEFMNIIIEN